MNTFDKYTRSQLNVIMNNADVKRHELYEYLASNSDVPEVVKDAIRKEAEVVTAVMAMVEERFTTLHSSCMFCKERIPTEVPTLAHICEKCDGRIFGSKVKP